MNINRRQFTVLLGDAPVAALLLTVRHAPAGVLERRVYDRAGIVPPASLLRRSGITRVKRLDHEGHVEYRIEFASLEERACAWDRFNSDAEWCEMRDGREVRVVNIEIENGRREIGE